MTTTVVVSAFIDFTKAFDGIDITLFYEVLVKHGISSQINAPHYSKYVQQNKKPS